MESERDELRLTKFNGREGEDFELWSLRLSAVLESKDLSAVMDGDAVTGTSTADIARHEQKKKKAKAIIVTSLGDKPLRVVQSAKSPAGMLKKLNDRYAASTTANRIAVLTTLIKTRYDSAKDMGEYLSEMESHFNRLTAMNSPVDEGMQVAILLVSVSATEALSGTVSAIKTMDPEKATWDYVSARLIEELRSQKLADGTESVPSSPTVAMARSGVDMNKVRCYRCGKKGHFARDCKSKPRHRKRRDEENIDMRAAMAGIECDDDSMFIMDSGCTQHISNNLSNFETIRHITPIKIHLANNKVVEARKEGTLRLNLHRRRGSGSNIQLLLRRVLYIPETVNMLSCTQLDSEQIS